MHISESKGIWERCIKNEDEGDRVLFQDVVLTNLMEYLSGDEESSDGDGCSWN